MNRCLIVFDIDAIRLQQHCGNANWENGYSDIRSVMSRNRFTNIQGMVYLSEVGVRQAHGTLAIQEVAIRFAWFEKCVTNVQFYDLADDFNAQSIIDGVTQAREAFERRIEGLRKQLLDAGLTTEKVEEIIGQQDFSMLNARQAILADSAEPVIGRTQGCHL